MKSSARRRQLWLRATILMCFALGLLAGPASAAVDLDTSTDTSTTLDSDAHWWVSTLHPVSYGGYQYTAYWDAPDPIDSRNYLELSRRRLSDGNTVTIRFSGESSWLEAPNDGHNYVGLGIDRNDGTIHISWGLHTTDRVHRYWRSETGCMSLAQESFNFANCGFRFSSFQADATTERSMTYPLYINDNRGGLYFIWRYNLTTNGDEYMNAYNDTTHTWRHIGRILRGRRSGELNNTYEFEPGNGTRTSSTTRGPYMYGMEFDKNERLHMAWAWREEYADAIGQHGIDYAYSDRSSEYRDWYSDAGTRIGTADTDAIDINDVTDTENIRVGTGWYSQGGYMALDSDNNPHIFAVVSGVQTADPVLISGRHAHYWRTTDRSWYSGYVEPSEWSNNLSSYGSMFVERANTAYAIWSRDELGWIPYNRELYVQRELPTRNVTWQPDGERDGFLDVQIFSAVSCLDTIDYVNTAISTAGNNQIRMRMRNDTSATEPIIFWQTAESPRWESGRLQRFRREIVARDRNYTEYTFTFTDPDWTGTLRTLEICMADGASSGSQSIDWIQLYNSTTRTVARTWEFTRGATLYAAEAEQANNWSTWRTEELLQGVSLAREDGIWGIDNQRYKDSKVVDFSALLQGAAGTESLTTRTFDVLGDDIAKDWRFDTDLINWTAQRDVSSFVQSNDAGNKNAGGTISGVDPQIVSATNLKIPIGERTDGFVHVKLKNTTAATTARVWFITDADRTWNSRRSASFTIRANSTYATYDIDMSRVEGWSSSTLYQMRLDPIDDGRTREGSFKVDRMYIYDR